MLDDTAWSDVCLHDTTAKHHNLKITQISDSRQALLNLEIQNFEKNLTISFNQPFLKDDVYNITK